MRIHPSTSSEHLHHVCVGVYDWDMECQRLPTQPEEIRELFDAEYLPEWIETNKIELWQDPQR